MFCPISQSELLIAGGNTNRIKYDDAYLFNVEQENFTRRVTDEMGLHFMVESAPVVESTGVVVALVEDIEENIKLIRYDFRSNELHVMQDYGRGK